MEIMTDRNCSHCGAPLKEKAISCPYCGSDENTGWSDNASVDWELPDYEEIVYNETKQESNNNLKLIVISIAIVSAIGLSFILALL
jgi:uncharacterized Zn finger protein (UPF0148 family)